jgi:hypothetical protein
MKNSIAAPIVIVAVAALAWTARALLPDPPAAPPRGARDTAASAPAVPDRPLLPRPMPTVRVAADEPPAADPAAAAADKPPAAPAPSAAQVRDRLDEVFRAEPVDAAWSQTATHTLQTKLAALLPAQSAVRSVDCRGSLCRIETSHAGVTEYRDFVKRTFLGQPELWNAGFFTNVIADPVPGQPVVTVAYLAREGQSLPSSEALFGGR